MAAWFVPRCTRAVRRWLAVFAVAALVAGSLAWARQAADLGAVPLARLPREAQQAFVRIERGGPFPYERDGIVFRNFEHRLPLRPRGYYREYTVPTPQLTYRGARRLIVGCEPGENTRAASRGSAGARALAHCVGPATLYYTDDHYRTFRRVVP